jgi:hypothetical protein
MRENHHPVTKTRLTAVAFFFVGLVTALLGCFKGKEVECRDPQPASQNTPAKKLDSFGAAGARERSPDDDWCRACVMGPKGWASCQTVYAKSKGESREALKESSKEKACDDAGFEKGGCPDKAVLGITCKGDKPPPGSEDAAKAMQAVFFGKKGAKKEKPEPQKEEK